MKNALKGLLLATVLPMSAHAGTVVYNTTELLASSINAGLDTATRTVNGLELTVTASDGGVLDDYMGTGPDGLALGATANGTVNSSTNGATNPDQGTYNFAFDATVTSITLNFGFLTANVTPFETISAFKADGVALPGGSISYTNTNGTTFSTGMAGDSITANNGVGNGSGIIGFANSGFTSLSFFHQQAPENLGFVVTSITVETSAVPVPAALPLMAAGAGLFGFMGWRRRKPI